MPASGGQPASSVQPQAPESPSALTLLAGFSQFEALPEPDDTLPEYGLSLIITTDGMPSSQWHPARGRDGYAPLVNTLAKGLAKKRTEAARPVVTTIGIGFQLVRRVAPFAHPAGSSPPSRPPTLPRRAQDSELLTKMSSTFLHMPDPGQIGPFIVNLLAAVRSTARLPEATGGSAANVCALIVSPAAALRQDVPAVTGYEGMTEIVIDESGNETLRIALGAVLYDQPRHLLLKTIESAGAFSVSLEVRGQVCMTTTSMDTKMADAGAQKIAEVQQLRLKAAATLTTCVTTQAASGQQADELVQPLVDLVAEIKGCSYASDAALTALANTLQKECIVATNSNHWNRWGAHYFRTLPCMLRAERRSNFRDECLQHFGKDARSREGVFETQSNMAELRFATLAPPEPSLLRPQYTAPTVGVPVAGGAQPATATPPPRPTVLPEEFMRGGGCFGPDARVLVAKGDGSCAQVKVSQIVAGDRLVGEEGRIAVVRCVVMTVCVGGRVQLTRLANGTELTEWHPVRDAAGHWRFPIMLGKRVVRATKYVYNFVLSPGHPTVLVDGLPCAALGHGLDAPVVAHPFWGTDACIVDLMSKPDWHTGRVVLQPRVV